MAAELDALVERCIKIQVRRLDAMQLAVGSSRSIIALALVHYGFRLKEVCELLGYESVNAVSVQLIRQRRYIKDQKKNPLYREYAQLCDAVKKEFAFISEHKQAREVAVIKAVGYAAGIPTDEVLKVSSRECHGVRYMVSMLLFERGSRYEDIRILLGYKRTSAVGNSINRHTERMKKSFKYPEYARIFDHSKRLLA